MLHDLFYSLGADAQSLEYIELTGNPLLRQRTDRPNIRTGRESQVSAQHAVGVCLQRGKAGLLEFSDEAVSDSKIAAVGKKLRFIDDASMSIDAVKVCFKAQNQTAVVIEVDHAKGSLKDPLTDSDLEQKLRELTAYGKPGYQTQQLIDQIWTIEKLDDVGQLMIMTA